MDTKETIKSYIEKSLERVKDFPDLNYPTDLSRDYYIKEQKKIVTECFRYGRILSTIWIQQPDKLFPDMPEVMSELITNNPQFLKYRKEHNIDIFNNIGQFVEYYTRWQNLDSLINGVPITYENMFKFPGERVRITQIISEQACSNGEFIGFSEVDATPLNQFYLLFDVIKEKYLQEKKVKGALDIVKRLFFKKFGWNPYREEEEKSGKKTDISLKKTIKDIIKPGARMQSKNKVARKDIERILDQN